MSATFSHTGKHRGLHRHYNNPAGDTAPLISNPFGSHSEEILAPKAKHGEQPPGGSCSSNNLRQHEGQFGSAGPALQLPPSPSNHLKVIERQRRGAAELGELDGGACAVAISVVEQRAGRGVVDDAVIGVGGSAGRVGLEIAGQERPVRLDDRGEDGVLQ